jgi:translation initiation factor 3 subunit D
LGKFFSVVFFLLEEERLTHVFFLNSFVSRTNPKSASDHVILGVIGYKPRDFAAQMNLNIANGWGIVRTIVDMVLKKGDGKFVLVKDPNKSVLRLYEVPADTFEDNESVADNSEAGEDAE